MIRFFRSLLLRISGDGRFGGARRKSETLNFRPSQRDSAEAPRILGAALLAVTLLVATAPGFGQTLGPQSTAAVFIKGTVRDASGALVSGATVVLEEKTRSESAEGETLADGTFSFLALKAGTYVVRVKKTAFREAVSEPMKLSLGERKQIELVLNLASSQDGDGGVIVVTKAEPSGSSQNKKPDPSPQKSEAMEFSDVPNFTVAGVTDWSNAGLHASETNARTSEALNRDMAALKVPGAPSSAKVSVASEAESHRAAGDRYENTGDALSAEREYETAVRLDPSEANYFAWGTELLVHKAIQPAVEVFTKGAGAHPESWRMLVGLGAALYASGSYEQAVQRVCHASDLQPKETVPYLFLGKMQRSATDSPACVEEKLARFARTEPEDALANYYYAVALWKRTHGAENAADLRKQEALLQKSVRVDPELAEAYLQLGTMYAAQNGFETAVRAYKRAIAANPELGEAHYRLGLAYKRAGDNTKAEQEFALYKQAQEAESAAAERQRKELQQFVVILKDKAKQ
jgi:tetratricopeptide (TPR) repeat protein